MNQMNQKKPYEKPSLRIIELAAEEVLGIGCKTASGNSATGASPCFPGNNCSQQGS